MELAPRSDRRAKEREGMAAWKDWVEKHQGAIVAMGGPLGKTKKITQRGIEDTSNDMGAFTVVRAESKEAAAKLFENHPWRVRRGNAGLADTWCLICGSAGSDGCGRPVSVPKLGHYLMIVLRSSNPAPLMSALPPKADIRYGVVHVRFVPIAEVALLRSIKVTQLLAPPL